MKTAALWILLCILSVTTSFSQENNYYDFTRVKTIKTLGTYKVKYLKRRTMIFDASAGDLSDKNIFDKGDTTGFNIDMMYRCKFADSSNYHYFRMYWQTPAQETILYVNFLGSSPSIENTEALFEIVEVPFIQKGKTSVCTIGDSQTWLLEGENYRHYWAQLNPNLKFIGNRTDDWGFGHEGEGGNSSADVIARMNKFKKADIYVLLIGTNDRKAHITVEQTVENIQTITNSLRKLKRKAQIYILTIPPCKEVQRDGGNQNINALIKTRFSQGVKNVHVLDLEPVFRERENWVTELFIDGLHPNEEGYRLMTAFLNENIR